MERDRQISKAKGVIRSLMGRYDKPHHRIHKQAADDNVNRLRALDGICGRCINLELTFSHIDGKDRVVVKCSKKHIPSALYWKTPPGEEAVCKDFDKTK